MKTNEEYRLLEQQNLELAAAIEVKDAAIETHLNPCGCFNGCEFCNGKVTLGEALAVKPSTDLLAKRDAALLREVAGIAYSEQSYKTIRQLADKRESGEWKPELEVK